MTKDRILRKIIELSNQQPTLYIVQAIQLLTTALLIVNESEVYANLLYSRAIKILAQGKKQ